MAIGDTSGVTVKYSAVGADRAARKDRKVRESLRRTGKAARKEAGSVNRWMERHKQALAAIGAAAAGLLAGILTQSPLIRAELAGVRMGFSLLAMTVGNDLAPAFEGATELALGAADAYADLDPAIRKPISAVIGLTVVTLGLLGGLAAAQTLISGTVVASFLSWAWSSLTAASATGALTAAFGGLSAVTLGLVAGMTLLAIGAGVLSAELLGITDVTPIVGGQFGALGDMFASLAFFLTGPFIAAVAMTVAFLKGDLGEAADVGKTFAREMGKSFMRVGIHAKTGVYFAVMMVKNGFLIMWRVAREKTKDGIHGTLSLFDDGVDGMANAILTARELIPAYFADMWDAAKKHSADALNWIINKADGAINKMIDAANKLPKVSIDNVDIGNVSGGGGATGAVERARDRAARRRKTGRTNLAGTVGPGDSLGDIRQQSNQQMVEELNALRDQRDRQIEQFAPSGADQFGGGEVGNPLGGEASGVRENLQSGPDYDRSAYEQPDVSTDPSAHTVDPADIERPEELQVDEGDDITEVNIDSLAYESTGTEEQDAEMTAEEIAKQMEKKRGRR